MSKNFYIKFYPLIIVIVVHVAFVGLLTFNFGLKEGMAKPSLYYLGFIAASTSNNPASYSKKSMEIQLIPDGNVHAVGESETKLIKPISQIKLSSKEIIKTTFLENVKATSTPPSRTTLKDLGIRDDPEIFKPLRIGR